MRNLSAVRNAVLSATAHSCCFGAMHLWVLMLVALFLCSGSTSFISGSDQIIGKRMTTLATVALSRSASPPERMSRTPSAYHPPPHTFAILSSFTSLLALSTVSPSSSQLQGRRGGVLRNHRSRCLRAALYKVQCRVETRLQKKTFDRGCTDSKE